MMMMMTMTTKTMRRKKMTQQRKKTTRAVATTTETRKNLIKMRNKKTTTSNKVKVKYLPRTYLFDGKPINVCEHIIETAYTLADNKVYISYRSFNKTEDYDLSFTCTQCN